MQDKELRKIWESINEFELIDLDKENLNREVKEHSASIEKKIVGRNRLEIIVAVFMMPVAAFIAYLHPSFLAKTGALLMFPYLFLVIYKLLAARKGRKRVEEFSDNLEFLKHSLSYYQNEKQLLDTVFYWYVLPCIPCVAFILLGSGLSGFKLVYAGAITIGMSYLIVRINQLTVERKIEPLIKRLKSEIETYNS
ncbi:MAG: hypothetical protein JNK44_07705 [Cyclobacteriaceae bacterium]|nr:hypothetical protein [Cyclobacteriaceae bacterium]